MATFQKHLYFHLQMKPPPKSTPSSSHAQRKYVSDNQRAFGFAKTLMGILKVNQGFAVASNTEDHPTAAIDHLLKWMGIRLVHKEEELRHIPADGPFIVVANHPMGGVDGLLLIQLLASVRPDVKVVAHFMLSPYASVNEFFIASTHRAGNPAGSSFIPPDAHQYLSEGHGICIFPSGTVSTYNLKAKTVKDKVWRSQVMGFIKDAGVPVVPVYIRGGRKLFLHLLNRVNPRLLKNNPSGPFFVKKEKEVSVRVGKVVLLKEQAEFEDVYEFGRYLRAKVYLLSSAIQVKPFFRPALFRKKWEEVVLPHDRNAIASEVATLKEKGAMLYEHKDLEVYWAHSEWIPHTLYEIGRLREITFREVGEGTGKRIDLDEYDLYYRHLFIWDRTEGKLVGAYRLGMGKEIMQRFGRRGFYLNSLFRMKPGFEQVLLEGIELGRSFITREYQLKPFSLFLLWKGILYFILKHPEYRYLFGPVSISGEFSKVSKYLIISFIKAHYYDAQMAELVTPRHEYIPQVDVGDPDVEAIRKLAAEDIKKLDRVIEEIEMGNFRLPALLKKYLGQNAKIIAFNVDPAFNNALDGLLVMDLFNVPADTLHGLAKEFGDKSLIDKYILNQREDL